MVIHNTGVQNTNTPASSGQTTANVREATARTQQTGRADTDEQRIREQLGTDRADETQESRKTADTREEAEARRLEVLARREEERENVIARSEDGDTLQVEPEDADITDEDIGEVTARSQNPPQIPPEVEEIEAPEVEPPEIPPVEVAPPPPPPVTIEVETEAEATAAVAEDETETTAEQTAEAADEDDTEQAVQQTSSNFAGISDDRLEQMYLRGEISRYDYETEIESREAEREQRAEDSGAFSDQMNTIERVGRKVDNDAEAVRDATSERANDTLTAEQRLDIIENLQQDNTEKARREEESSRVWQSQFLA